MHVCVVGLGKIGLPLAVAIARKGHVVHGADSSPHVVELVNAGRAPFPGEAHLDEWLAAEVRLGHLSASQDTSASVALSDVVVVVVPLHVDEAGVPDFGGIDAATIEVASGLKPGTLVSYETTLPVGTTRNRFAPSLSGASELELGRELFVCHSPERVFSGRIFADLGRYPKLIGGIDGESARRAVEFYSAFLEFDERSDLDRPNGVWDLGSAEAAELAKLAETTYRDINIAFANELARFADKSGVNVYGVIEAANSQPFSHIHNPGIAVGGHCIPVYPMLYLAGDPEAALPAAARRVNLGMPDYAVGRLEHEIGDLADRRIAVLGASYRGGVKEAAFSGVYGVVEALAKRQAFAMVHDPLYTDDELRGLGFTPYRLGEQCDAAIVQADHSEYRHLETRDLPGATVVIDGRRVLDQDALGPDVRVVVLGRSDEPPASDAR